MSWLCHRTICIEAGKCPEVKMCTDGGWHLVGRGAIIHGLKSLLGKTYKE